MIYQFVDREAFSLPTSARLSKVLTTSINLLQNPLPSLPPILPLNLTNALENTIHTIHQNGNVNTHSPLHTPHPRLPRFPQTSRSHNLHHPLAQSLPPHIHSSARQSTRNLILSNASPRTRYSRILLPSWSSRHDFRHWEVLQQWLGAGTCNNRGGVLER